MIFVGNKRGRPKKDVSKTREFKLRLTDDEVKELEYVAYSSDISKSEVVRKALKMLYNLEKTRY